MSISQDTRVLFTARRWNSGRADKLTEHVSFKRMAIAMPENSAVLLPYPVSRTGCCGWGLRWSKDNRPRPSNARRELDCGNGTGDSQRGIHRSARARGVVSTHAQARECRSYTNGKDMHRSTRTRGVTLALPWFPPTSKPANAQAKSLATKADRKTAQSGQKQGSSSRRIQSPSRPIALGDLPPHLHKPA